MKTYFGYFDAGYGKTYCKFEAEDQSTAEKYMYDGWREEADTNADWGAEEYDPDKHDEYDPEEF